MEPLTVIATFILIGLANGVLQRTGELVMDKSLEKILKLTSKPCTKWADYDRNQQHFPNYQPSCCGTVKPAI